MKEQAITSQHPEALEARTRWDELKQERSPFEAEWQDIARLIRGQRDNLITTTDPRGLRTKLALTSVPIIAQTNFAAELYGTLTNPANRWHALVADDPDLAKWKPMKDWQDQVTERVLASFRPSASSFYSAAIQIYSDIVSFGTGAQYDEVRADEGKILDVTLSLGEVVFDIDAFGRVCECVRKFHLKPRAAAQMFQAQYENLPAKIREGAEQGSNDTFVFFQHVKPNRDWQRGKLGPRGKRWASLYVCEVDDTLVRRAGYDEMPFHAPRWSVESGKVYGRGVGSIALPAVRVMNRMQDANIRAGQKAADPTLLAPNKEDWGLSGHVRPGHTLYGGVNFRGERMIHALDNFSATGLTLEMQQQVASEVQDAFQWSLLTLANRTGLSDIETLEQQERHMRMSAPNHGRIQEEYLAPKIARRFSLLWRHGQLPPPPEGIPQGAGLQVQYQSAAAQAQKSAEGAAVMRVLSDVAVLGQIDPAKMARAADRISTDDVLEVLIEARGGPSRILVSREDADAAGQQRAQQAQLQQAMEMAQAGGAVAKDMAQAAGAMEGA